MADLQSRRYLCNGVSGSQESHTMAVMQAMMSDASNFTLKHASTFT